MTKTENGAVTRYEYGPCNELLSEISPMGPATRYAYDAGGRLVTETKGMVVTRRTWDAGGRLASIMLPDGTVETYGYNADGIRVA